MKIGLGKRTGGLVASIVLAALASLALISYMRGVESRAFAGAELVDAFVARDTIAAGTAASDAIGNGSITTTSLPRKAVAEGSISSLEELRGLVARTTILPGEQIARSRFGTASEAVGGPAIPKGRQAMSVEVATPPGVAGFVRPGSRVSVIAHLDVPGSDRSGQEPRSEYLLQNIEVLAVGVNRADAPEAEAGARTDDRVLVTLAVTAAEAERLVYAVSEGDIWLTLLPPGSGAARTSGQTKRSVFR